MSHPHGGRYNPSDYPQMYHVPIATAHGGAYTPPGAVPNPLNQQPPGRPMMVSPVQSQSSGYASSTQKGPIQYSQQVPQHPPPAHTYAQQSLQKDGNLGSKQLVPMVATQVTPVAASTDSTPEKELPVVLKGEMHFFNPRSLWRWRNPYLYQEPGYAYDERETVHRHRDYAGREAHKVRSDRYLHHNDGYLRNMYVAATDVIYEAPGTSTWKRTYVQQVAPWKVRIATWVVDFTYDPESWNDWWIMVLRALPATLLMNLVFWDGKPQTQLRNLYYAPVLYTYHNDAKVWSNTLENGREQSAPTRNNQVYRLLKPRHLCFLREPTSAENEGVSIGKVSDWEKEHGDESMPEYLFVAYSTEQFSHRSEADLRELHDIAETACRAANLPAYWVACSCMWETKELEADVFRISDVLRSAKEMIIVVGRGKTAADANASTDTLLREWGSRMWTFPEVLLSPGRSIKVYTRGQNLQMPTVVPKNQFASRVWSQTDADSSRHMIDHFLGTISLGRIELAVLALECLYKRKTTEYLAGDHAYALMSLLRQRPQIDRTDSAFQAFARLSLANDSDRLLERYICTLPVKNDQAWHDMTDAYQSSMWDIDPYCQIAGVANDDTVIIDGAWGMSIRWKSFYPVYWSSGPSWKRFFATLLLEWNGFIFIISCSLMGSGTAILPAGGGLIAIGFFLLLVFFYFWIMMPKLVRIIYGGKFCEVQAEMFGFEGHLNAPTIERSIFGGNFGRFSWTSNGSPLSRSTVNEFNEVVGMDPCKDPEIRMKVEAARHAKPGEKRIFTLVDTYNMQLTLFEAIRPPVTLMFCASEGGMQRAIGCSYEWETQTMYRETVLRMPTPTLNKMDRVSRFRLGLLRKTYPSRPKKESV